MAITVETRTKIVELTVGMVGAAPGAAILSELAEVVDAGLSLNDLAIAIANNPAFKVLYPSFLTNTEFATNYLTALMGSEVDSTTLSSSVDVMVADLNAGMHRGAAMYKAISTLSATAETDANLGAAAAALNNKTEVAVHYSVTTQQSSNSLDDLKAVVNGVTSSDATVTSKKAEIDGTAAAGTEFTLTTGLNNVKGTTLNDTILGIVGTGATFTVGDIIDGGAGSDTLRIATDAATVNSSTAQVSNVEHLVVTSGGTVTTLNGGDDGYSTITLDSSSAGATTTVSGLGASTAATVTSVGTTAGSNVTVTYTGVTGSSDASTLTFGSGGNANSVLSALGIETLNLNFTGKVNFGGAAVLTNLKTLNLNAGGTSTLTLSGATGTKAAVNVSGAGGVTLGTLNASIATVDASASTAGVTLTTDAAQTSIKGGSGTDKITVGAAPTTTLSVTAGAGNDTVTVSALDLTVSGAIDGTNEIIDGGDGTDTLVIDEADLTAALVKANVAKATSFEVLQAAAAVTAFAANGFAQASFTFAADNTVGAARTYTADAGDTLTLSASNSAHTLTLNPILDSGTDVINLTLASVATSLTQFGITISQVETLNISSLDLLPTTPTTNTITTLTVQNNTKINITGNADLTFTTATGTELTIDGSAATGKLGITVVGGNDTITGGSAVDTLNGGAGIDTINGGGGNDVITGGVGADILTGGDGADIFIVSTAAAATDSTTSAADSITDFNTGGSDVLRFLAADNKAGAATNAPVAAATVQISAGGKVTFHVDDDTLSEKIAAVGNDNTNVATREVVFFEHGSDTYVYGAGNDTTVAADAFLVKLTGVTGLTAITESTVTAGDFTLA